MLSLSAKWSLTLPFTNFPHFLSLSKSCSCPFRSKSSVLYIRQSGDSFCPTFNRRRYYRWQWAVFTLSQNRRRLLQEHEYRTDPRIIPGHNRESFHWSGNSWLCFSACATGVNIGCFSRRITRAACEFPVIWIGLNHAVTVLAPSV